MRVATEGENGHRGGHSGLRQHKSAATCSYGDHEAVWLIASMPVYVACMVTLNVQVLVQIDCCGVHQFQWGRGGEMSNLSKATL
jgi:hypothetical protein